MRIAVIGTRRVGRTLWIALAHRQGLGTGFAILRRARIPADDALTA